MFLPGTISEIINIPHELTITTTEVTVDFGTTKRLKNLNNDEKPLKISGKFDSTVAASKMAVVSLTLPNTTVKTSSYASSPAKKETAGRSLKRDIQPVDVPDLDEVSASK